MGWGGVDGSTVVKLGTTGGIKHSDTGRHFSSGNALELREKLGRDVFVLVFSLLKEHWVVWAAFR